jgi:hypothetical protein
MNNTASQNNLLGSNILYDDVNARESSAYGDNNSQFYVNNDSL